MAGLFLNSSSDMSAGDFLEAAAYYCDVTISTYPAGVSVAATAVTLNITPTIAGDCIGIGVPLGVASKWYTTYDPAVETVTVTLQENTGSWVDRASKTLTYNEIMRTDLDGDDLGSAFCNWVFFEFASSYAITAAASTWRISVVNSANDTSVIYWRGSSTSALGYCVVLDSAATYSSGDDLMSRQNVVLTIDQDATFNIVSMGSYGEIGWDTSGSHALTIAKWKCNLRTAIRVGSSVDRVSYANQATISIAALERGLVWSGQTGAEFEFYGEEANCITHIAEKPSSGTYTLVVEDDMSADWSPGDTVRVYRDTNSSAFTIDSISGTSITFVETLYDNHSVGWGVVNITCAQKMGILMSAFALTGNAADLWKFEISGAAFVNSTNLANLIYSNFVIRTFDRYSPYLFESLYMYPARSMTVNIHAFYPTNDDALAALAGTTLRRIIGLEGVASSRPRVIAATPIIIDECYSGGYVNQLQVEEVRGGTIRNCRVSTGWNHSAYFSIFLNNCSLTQIANCMFAGNSVWILGQIITFVDCSFDDSEGIYPVGAAINISFVDCSFGQNTPNTQTVLPAAYQYQVMRFHNCLCDNVLVDPDEQKLMMTGSVISFSAVNQNANDHRNFYREGNISSAGFGLSDTTVHTAGGLCMRFESLSETAPLAWQSTIPTGDISGLDMVIGVWCKIASADYYAGTHRMPRLSVDYDDGTTAYAEAVESTDWQFVSVQFAPATGYGQITVELSTMTDATGIDAYVYFDDFSTLYPQGVQVSTGSMDLWAAGLPVTPFLTTGLSAADVWSVPSDLATGAGTVGEALDRIEKTTGDNQALIIAT